MPTPAPIVPRSAADLRSSHSSPVTHLHLGHGQPSLQRLHLHLGVPAIRRIAHIKLAQRLPADGAERTHVAVAVAEQQADEPGRKSVAKSHVGPERARLGALHTTATHEIGLTREDRCQEQWQVLWVVAVVGVQDHQDVGRRAGEMADAGKASAAVAGPRLVHDIDAVLPRNVTGAIRAGVVDHDDARCEIARDLREDLRQRLRLVMRGHDDRDRGWPGGPGR